MDFEKLAPQLRRTDDKVEVRLGDEDICQIKIGFGEAPKPPSLPAPPPADVTGVLFDNGEGRVTYVIHHTGDMNRTTIAVQRINGITWWKAIVAKNESGDISKIETRDNDGGKEMTLMDGNIPGNLKLAFAKAGALNSWKGIFDLPVSKEMLLGKRITYTWERD